MAKRWISFPRVSVKTGDKSRSTISRYIKTLGFPEPIQIGPNSVVWDEEAVDAWIEQRAKVGYTPKIVAPGARKGRRKKALDNALVNCAIAEEVCDDHN